MDIIVNLWYDDCIRQLLLGLVATGIISIVKYASSYAANSSAFKYSAVVLLAACGALYSEVWDDGVLSSTGFISNFVSIMAFSIGGYQTIGKAAKGILQKYVPQKDEEDELVQEQTSGDC
jgi:hypothetical protein